MTAKVSNHCQTMYCKTITVNASERACVNCIWYEQYYRRNRGNISASVPTSTGYCLLKECERGALRQPCENFETERRKIGQPGGRNEKYADL